MGWQRLQPSTGLQLAVKRDPAYLATLCRLAVMRCPAIGVKPRDVGISIGAKIVDLHNPNIFEPRCDKSGQVELPVPRLAWDKMMRIRFVELRTKRLIHLIAGLRNTRADGCNDSLSISTQRFHCSDRVFDHTADRSAPAGMGCTDYTFRAICKQNRCTIGSHDSKLRAGQFGDQSIGFGALGKLPLLCFKNRNDIRRMHLLQPNCRIADHFRTQPR